MRKRRGHMSFLLGCGLVGIVFAFFMAFLGVMVFGQGGAPTWYKVLTFVSCPPIALGLLAVCINVPLWVEYRAGLVKMGVWQYPREPRVGNVPRWLFERALVLIGAALLTFIQLWLMGTSLADVAASNVGDSLAIWLRIVMWACAWAAAIVLAWSQVHICRHPACVYVDYDEKTDRRSGRPLR